MSFCVVFQFLGVLLIAIAACALIACRRAPHIFTAEDLIAGCICLAYGILMIASCLIANWLTIAAVPLAAVPIRAIPAQEPRND